MSIEPKLYGWKSNPNKLLKRMSGVTKTRLEQILGMLDVAMIENEAKGF